MPEKNEMDQALKELKRTVENPEYFDENYEDVTENFYDPPVGELLGKIYSGNEFEIEEFFDLSEEHKRQFLKALPDLYNLQKTA